MRTSKERAEQLVSDWHRTVNIGEERKPTHIANVDRMALITMIATTIDAVTAEAMWRERKTCAALAETFGSLGTELDRGNLMGRNIAVAIRARNQG